MEDYEALVALIAEHFDLERGLEEIMGRRWQLPDGRWVVEMGKDRRITLAGMVKNLHRRYRAEVLADGTIVLTPAEQTDDAPRPEGRGAS